ncbi:hypothetical protein BCR43DRAFT_504404 [Syncephalastrum racemosum]|uniref:F-box domain-containing protein n=1 Tax=Syncephalastrum racemosum TaxID=13706 RepID=A0A1X2HEU1_SYNRA|nr:hypothetical protein BCR43DRAFT_504404 [Syncephalastrum racemosum]
MGHSNQERSSSAWDYPLPVNHADVRVNHGIQEARRDAMAVTKKGRSHKVDPTDALPVDVILLVFENFEIKELLVCATVSRHWHRYILNLPVWSRLHVDLLQTSISTMRARQQGLAKVLGPELRVIHIKTDASLFTILSLLSKAGCTNVKKFGMRSVLLC